MADDVEQKTIVRQTNGVTTLGTAGVGMPQSTTVLAVPAWKMVGVRAIRSGLQAFLSFLGIGATGVPEYVLNLPPADFLTKLKLACIIGAGTAAASAVQDTIEFLKNFDMTHPQLRG